MSLGQILFGIYFALVGAYLSIVLARLLHQNGRVLQRMEEGFRKISELIVSEERSTRELIKVILEKK